MDSVKEWSVTTFKCTKQLLNEKRGVGLVTNDTELQEDIDQLQVTKSKLVQLLMMLNDFKSHHGQASESQRQLCNLLNEMYMKGFLMADIKSNGASIDINKSTPKITFGKQSSTKQIISGIANLASTSSASGRKSNDSSNVRPKSYEKINDFLPILTHINNSNIVLSDELQKNIVSLNLAIKNSEKLSAALTFICSNISTLIHKTIEDTLVSIQELNFSRLELDAERNSQPSTRTFTTYSSNKLKLARQRYELLREEVQIKMKFLDDNILKVMHKQLLLFHSVFSAYSASNTSALDSALRQFSIKWHD